MNKALIKKLKAIADTLPPVLENKPLQLSSEEAKKHYKKADDKRSYYVQAQQPVDHLNKLKAAFKKGGEDGVTEYVQWARSRSYDQRKQKQKEVNTL